MDYNRTHVQRWLEENFHLEQFQIREMPLVPGVVVLKDINNDTMLVYWDINAQKIAFEFKN